MRPSTDTRCSARSIVIGPIVRMSRRSDAARAEAAQDRADAQHELLRAERLREVVVGAEREAANAIRLFAARGEHEHRDVARGRLRAKLLEHVVARGARQHEIEHDERRDVPVARRSSASGPDRRRRDTVAGFRRGDRRRARRCPASSSTTSMRSPVACERRSGRHRDSARCARFVDPAGGGESSRRSSRSRRRCVRREARSRRRIAWTAPRTADASVARSSGTGRVLLRAGDRAC